MHHRHAPARWQSTVLGVLLCLLAAAFAFEAKMAWFGPAGSPAAQISASKLQPADAPKLTPPSHGPIFLTALIPELAAFLVLVAMGRTATRIAQPERPPLVPASPGFSPSLFFRPPPVR
ncbi:hypothetical protein DYQ86_27225 [Acidobacteria bacterium AB60]|nr:hypothetical protein DYQ86_27225 [Acidobacteria bacterium AB60]